MRSPVAERFLALLESGDVPIFESAAYEFARLLDVVRALSVPAELTITIKVEPRPGISRRDALVGLRTTITVETRAANAVAEGAPA